MYRRIIALLCLPGSLHAFAGEEHTEQARQNLKNYGLSHCILAPFKEQSALEKDIKLSAGAYSFMGKGLHTVVQNEDTLEVTHDPYAETEKYMASAYLKTSSTSKQNGKNIVFYSCLEIYNSPEFDAFIKSQDQYLQN
ncbi:MULTISPECIES: T6SS amidase immunity protein Tai4 family protein [unclassified Pseudomonas]|uniref:T6SS amidase immunity protein Tai4 family protein n=1 Tax=unclassified Pseudomonas TaxID=196821 RepID=UPI0020109A7C|nr:MULTISPECIES: T6SS amidase immunity protein Tai4 family protein [unclassified Pseudomonas]